MTNFIAFRFTDNDFHMPLRLAVQHIADNHGEETTLQQYHKYAVHGTYAYDLLRNIAWNRTLCVDNRLLMYIDKTLVVTGIRKLDELDSGFEGYILDLNLKTVFYHGY